MTGSQLRETARVEAFSDGVLAIAITLLGLTLTVPVRGDVPLARAMVHAWPHYLAYVTSFTTIGIIWINHHRVFTYIHRVSHGLLLWNGLLLMSVCLVPFTTGLVSDHLGGPDARTAASVYGASFVVTTLCFHFLWKHATRHELLDPGLSPRTIRTLHRQYGFGPVLYLGTFGLSFFSALGSVVVNAALAIFFALPPSGATAGPWRSGRGFGRRRRVSELPAR